MWFYAVCDPLETFLLAQKATEKVKLTHAHACKIKADYVSEFSALVTLGGMQAKHNPQPEEQLIDLCQQAIDWCWICVNVCNGDG